MIARLFWRLRRKAAPLVCVLVDHREDAAISYCRRCDRYLPGYFWAQRNLSKW